MRRSTFISMIICAAVALFSMAACSRNTPQKSAPNGKRLRIVVIHNLNHHDEPFYNLKNLLEAEFADTNLYRIDYTAITEAYYPWIGEDYSSYVINKLDKMQKLGWEPDLFVIYSDQIAHAAARVHHPLLDSVPVIFTGVYWPDHEGLLASRENFTGFRTPLGISKTLDLMRDMGCPSWVITNLDDTYLDRYLARAFRDQVGGKQAKYKLDIRLDDPSSYQSPDKWDRSVQTIIPLSLKNEAPQFNNKFMFNCFDSGCSYLRSKDDRYGNLGIANSVGTYYSLTPEHFGIRNHQAMGSCAGGWFVSLPDNLREVHKMADEILLDGTKPSDIPWRELQGEWWLDWKVLKSQYSYGNNLPGYAQVVNLPWRDRNRVNSILAEYWVILAIIILWAILSLLALGYYFTYQAKKRILLQEGDKAKKMLTHLDASLSAANCHFFRAEPNGRITFSGGFAELVGKDKVPSTMHQFTDLLTDEHRDDFVKAVTSSSSERCEKIRVHINGHCYDVSLDRIRQKNGSLMIYGILFNVDAACEAERRRKEAFRLEEQSNLKRAFLASMGHEIRTPLNAIIGYSRLLFDMYDELSPEEKNTYSSVIDQNTEQLLALIDGVITYSEDQGKEPDIVLSRKNVSELMDELYMTYRVIVPAHLSFDLVKGLPTDFIKVNRSCLLQIVSNLMNNAVKFTKEGGITLGWREEDNKVVIFVTDTGCGIAPEFLNSVFDKYSKANSSTEGAGLGLSLCRKLVDKMNGEIRVTSTLGSGSCFEVLFKRDSYRY